VRAPAGGDPLGAEVRRLFRELPRGGAPEPDGCGWVEGAAGVRREGTRIVIHLLPGADGTVTDARFQALGCPHTLAAVAWLVGRLPGRPAEALPPGGPADWARELQVPVEKLGQLLVIEDALLAALEKWRGTAVPPAAKAT
jgi:hypothetical protein